MVEGGLTELREAARSVRRVGVAMARAWDTMKPALLDGVRHRDMTRMAMGMAAALAFALLVCGPARADYEAGQRAWDAGNVDAALVEWRSAADAGDRHAMLALGRLYVRGLGVPQSYVEAHTWLNLAASRGEMAALEERDALAAKMTPAQIAAAQERATAWRPGGDGAAATQSAQTRPAATPQTPAQAPSDAGPPPPRAIREAQSLLGVLGYRPGPADGIWGRRTGEAYRAFLRDAGLAAAATLTPEALRTMRALAKGRAGGAGAGTTAAAGASPAPSRASAPPVRPDALHRAAQAGDIDGLKAALAAGVGVDARDGRGWTALMHAVNKGYTLLVEPLLAADASVDVRGPDGATALFMAAVHGHTDIIVMLMRAGASVSVRGPKGKTAVDVARTRYGEPDAARESGEDPAVVVLLEGKTLADDRPLIAAGKQRDKKPGLRFKDCVGCPELVVVPAGSFRMGSPSGEKGRYKDEGPRHRVTIGAPFAVGVYEVTFGEWDVCVSGGGCNGYRPDDRGWGRGNRPVMNVNWEDAKAYVGWLSRKTGKGYRLLSESEWEYVARAGTETAYHFDNDISPSQANYRYRESGYGETAPVGSYPSNAFGLHDVHGNVWEWVEDCWNDSYRGAPSDGSAWESGNCGRRVLRGGSWNDVPRNLRSADRYWVGSGGRFGDFGFRIARTLTP